MPPLAGSPSGVASAGAVEADGRPLEVTLFLVGREDAPAVRRFLIGLSQETRRRRFQKEMPYVREWAVEHFTPVNRRERLVVGARAEIDGRPEVVGLADASLEASGEAEVAIVVADDLTGQGIGTRLMWALAVLLALRGATSLRADTTAGNEAMVAIMRGLGPTLEKRIGRRGLVARTLLDRRRLKDDGQAGDQAARIGSQAARAGGA